MTLESTIRHKIDALPTASGSASTGPVDVLAADAESGWTVSFTLQRRDELSCMIRELEVKGKNPAAADLADWAGQVARRVTVLMQPLKVLEIDKVRNEAIVRSDALTELAGVPTYFEIKLNGTTSACVRRFQVPANGKREQVPFALTHETLIKLAQDITSVK